MLGPDGPLGFATNVRIEETNAPDGRPTAITVRALGSGVDVNLRFDVASAVTIDKQRVQLHAEITLSQTGRPLVSQRIKLPKDFVLDAVNTGSKVRWSRVPSDDAVIIEFEHAGVEGNAAGASDPGAVVGALVAAPPPVQAASTMATTANSAANRRWVMTTSSSWVNLGDCVERRFSSRASFRLPPTLLFQR